MLRTCNSLRLAGQLSPLPPAGPGGATAFPGGPVIVGRQSPDLLEQPPGIARPLDLKVEPALSLALGPVLGTPLSVRVQEHDLAALRESRRQVSPGAQARTGPERYLDPQAPVFGISDGQVGRRIRAAALHAGTELTDLQNAGRWQSTSMPARYSRGQKARGPAAARWPGTTGSTGETLPLCGDW